MDDFLSFPSREYFLMLLLLLAARGMDVLSTWVATPNLVLEGNPIAKKLGWRWGVPINIGICSILAFWPLPAIVISTTSVLVAARNFQSAWLMRSLGEQAYRDWHVERIQETRITLYLFCLAGNTLLTAAVGAAVIYFSNHLVVLEIPKLMTLDTPSILSAIGVGVIAYAVAVAFYTLLAIWRMRRASLRRMQRTQAAFSQDDSKTVRAGDLAALSVRDVAHLGGK